VVHVLLLVVIVGETLDFVILDFNRDGLDAPSIAELKVVTANHLVWRSARVCTIRPRLFPLSKTNKIHNQRNRALEDDCKTTAQQHGLQTEMCWNLYPCS
jgi:hypothetical protein